MSRNAFTLIEMLIVITIISVLAALITVASFAFIDHAKESATRTTIKKVSEALNDRLGGLERFQKRPLSRLQRDWTDRGWLKEWQQGLSYTDGMFVDTNAALKALSRKYYLKDIMPMTQEELKNCYWFKARYTTPAELATAVADIDRPGEVVYYALLYAPCFGAQHVMEGDFSPKEMIDPDKDGFDELCDQWGESLRFYRWPTRLVNGGLPPSASWDKVPERLALIPTAPSGSDLKVDPDDPFGVLQNTGGPSVTKVFHDESTWHQPLVMSAGHDMLLGVKEPDVEPLCEMTSLDEISDNITNTNLR